MRILRDTDGSGDRESKDRSEKKRTASGRPSPKVLSCEEIFAVESAVEEMLFEEGYPLPARGLTLRIGAARSGKTLLCVQEAVAVATGRPLFDNYRCLRPGAIMIIEADDNSGPAAIQTILKRSGVDPKTPTICMVEKPGFCLGPMFCDWLRNQIVERSLKLVVLDSYTAMRGPRPAGCDFVKVEQSELMQLDALAKEMGCAIVLIHHTSKGSTGLEWAQQGAGSFAITMAVEGQTCLERFADLEPGAKERLLRMRTRHSDEYHLVLRFRKETLNFEHVLDGAASEFYPAIKQIDSELGRTVLFGPPELMQATGVSRATAYRIITRLRHAGALEKVNSGTYRLSQSLRL
jgi:hypothetical protein